MLTLAFVGAKNCFPPSGNANLKILFVTMTSSSLSVINLSSFDFVSPVVSKEFKQPRTDR